MVQWLDRAINSRKVENRGTEKKTTLESGHRSVEKGSDCNLVVIYASGFPPYKDDKHEIAIAGMKLWLPSSVDFLMTAVKTNSRSFFGARNKNEFFNILASRKDKICRLILIGHGDKGKIALEGSTIGATTETLSADTFSDKEVVKFIKNKNIKNKFQKDAVIDILACKSAVDKSFMAIMGNALGVKVRGLEGPAYWILVYKKNKIIDRGSLCLKFSQGECVKQCNNALLLPFK